ncbi:methionine ABC transporter ATP-binding protein [Salinithrix halophila]|uniref:Methionine ABC transporter ATP-binding protein n=1 Tax=Salinithrix halophila TaxID=1485204 RepID=A0ABV8JEP8_9BACL
MLQLKEIQKTYPSRSGSIPVVALKDVNLEVNEGEIFGIIGRSGAGKSTLLRLVNGLETPDSGEVWVDGWSITRLKERELRQARTKIGMIFQHFNLLWSRTVWDNVAFPLEVAGRSKEEIRQKVNHLLERVGLSDRAKAYPSQLSGGQKQRVGIARALANDPKVLLCDEATSALDPETTGSILQLLKEINRDTGITTLLITHEMSVVQAICGRMGVMDDGRMIEVGEVSEIFRNPSHPVTRQFVRQTLLKEQSTPFEDKGRDSSACIVVQCRFPGLSDVWEELRKEADRRQLQIHVLAGGIDPSTPWTLRVEGDRETADRIVTVLRSLGAEAEVAVGVS